MSIEWLARLAPRWPALGSVDWLSLAWIALALLVGLLAGSGNLMLVGALIAAISLISMLTMDPRWLVAMLVVMAFFLVGPGIYFAGIDGLRWMVPAFLFVMLAQFLLARLTRVRHLPAPPLAAPAFAASALGGILVLSSMLGSTGLGEILSATKFYIALLLLLLLLAGAGLSSGDWVRLFSFVAWAGLLQFPFALVQRFVFAARKVRSAEWDAVVGSFPGNAEGGGASAGMGVFLVLASVMGLALFRGRQMSKWIVAALFGVSVVTIMLAEVKAVVLLIPIAAALYFRAELMRSPGKVLAASLAASLVMGAVLVVYTKFQYAESAQSLTKSDKPKTPLEAISNQLDADRQSRFTGEPSRLASLRIWWDAVPAERDWQHLMLGYGPGATQFSRLGGPGVLFPKYPFRLDQTSLTLLLWEAGVAGLLAVVALISGAAHTAARLSRQATIPEVHRHLLHGVSVCLWLYLLTLPYKSFLFVTAPSQVLFAAMVVYATFWRLSARPPRRLP